MAITFEVRDAGGVPVIDWSERGGIGCRPATTVEIELIARVAQLETALRETDAALACRGKLASSMITKARRIIARANAT